MPQHGADQGREFSDLYGRFLTEFADQIREGGSTYGHAGRSVREEIVRCVWFGGHFTAAGLATDDGRRIEVQSPGWWNVEGGPDFVRAEFLLEGQGRVVGDVEVHTLASSWRAHGHHKQPSYDDVALHVVMWNDGDQPHVRTQDGRDVPQLTLSTAMREDVEELVEVIGPEEEGADEAWTPVEGRFCGRAVRDGELGTEWLGRLLDAAGDHRVLTRAADMEALFENHPPEQILYERIAEALGYKNNRMPFMQLAGLLPLADMRAAVPAELPVAERALMLEAAYFAVGGFLDGSWAEAEDAESAEYAAGLRDAWGRMRAGLCAVTLGPKYWHLAGTRPANRPTRRIAALARLCADHLHTGLFRHFMGVVRSARAEGRSRIETAVRRALAGALIGLEHPYWSRHYGFGGRRLEQPRALIGDQRATSVLVDVLLPALLAHANQQDDPELVARLNALWTGLPRRQDNAVTRRMNRVLFADAEGARRVVSSARRQQGLHQLYRDCCRTDEGCEHCVLYLAHRSGRKLADV